MLRKVKSFARMGMVSGVWKMKKLIKKILCYGVGLALVGGVQAAELAINLSKTSITNAFALPEGFKAMVTGEGKAGGWKIVLDDAPSFFPSVTPEAASNTKQPVISQEAGVKVDEHFPMLVYTDEVFGDFTLTLKIKMVSGEMEQMAGVAFRIQDEKNYYVVRASALGNTFRFYKYVDGVRTPAIGETAEISANEWHDLKVECRGNKIRCSLDDKIEIPELTDLSYNKGLIGLWTKSDSVSYFRDINIDFTPRETLAETVVQAALKRFDRLEDLKMFARPEGGGDYVVVAAKNPDDVGKPISEGAKNCIRDNAVYTGETRKSWTVTMPLLDPNGDPMGAVTVVLKKFLGQTKKNALNRGRAVMDRIQRRVTTAEDLVKK